MTNVSKGIGLIEQITAVAILAVLGAIAVPSFHRMLIRHDVRLAQADYIANLQHARNLAVNEGARMIFCPSRDKQTCSQDGNWNEGWLIGRADLVNKGQPAGPPLYVGGRFRKTLTITGSAAKKYVWFGPDGSAVNTNQNLFFCAKDDPQHVLVVRIALHGRVRGGIPDSTDNFSCSG